MTMTRRHITISTYADADGARHEIAVDVDPGGRFRVLDLAAEEAWRRRAAARRRRRRRAGDELRRRLRPPDHRLPRR